MLSRWTAADVAWVSGQVVLFVVAFVVVPSSDGGPGRFDVPGARAVGWTLMAAGLALGVAAAVVLGRNLVPQPTPVEGSTLVDRGPYGWVRHPIYTAVALAAIGSMARTPSVTGLAAAIALVVFLDRKAAHEERLLTAAHPDYPDYAARVRGRLVPGIG